MNWAELRFTWQEWATERLAQELREGDHVHVVTGNLKASFEARGGNQIVTSVPYASEELNRPGNRNTSPYTPHDGAILSAWKAIEPDAIDELHRLLAEELDWPTIEVR